MILYMLKIILIGNMATLTNIYELFVPLKSGLVIYKQIMWLHIDFKNDFIKIISKIRYIRSPKNGQIS